MAEVIKGALAMLVSQTPALLAYLVGLILGLAFLRRYPRPAGFVLAASLLALLATVAHAFATTHHFARRAETGETAEETARALGALGLMLNSARAVSFALLLAAAFAGRSQQPAPRPRPRRPADEGEGGGTPDDRTMQREGAHRREEGAP